MLEKSGVIYYLNLIGLGTGNYLIHYSFENGSGSNYIPNSATQYPQYSGEITNTGGLWNYKSGSGLFTGQKILVSSSGLGADTWSHIFVIEKTGSGAGVLVDTSKTGAIMSGYSIGINANNRMYIEGYNENGPFSTNSSIILGTKNIIAFSKNNNQIDFYSYDFNNQKVISDSYPVSDLWYGNSDKLVIGGASGGFSFIETPSFSGILDEYVYFNTAISAEEFRYLSSGLVSDYVYSNGAVTTYSGLQITGYSSGITGVTGITGYTNVIVGSGANPFGTGYEYYYSATGLTGYLTTGLNITPLSGYVNFYITGDPSSQLVFNTGLIRSFIYDQISYIRKIDNDFSELYSVTGLNNAYNKKAKYSDAEDAWQLDRIYSEDAIEVYLNGQAVLSTGYSITGDYYNSGVVLSGQYRLNGFYLDTTGYFTSDDTVIYDSVSGTKTLAESGSFYSGQLITAISNGLIFLNGQLLTSGIDYISNGASQIQVYSNAFSGQSGAIYSFPKPQSIRQTGYFFNEITGISKNNSLLYLNGQRMAIDIDYVENSKYDLIGNSGIFDVSLLSIYNNESGYFE